MPSLVAARRAMKSLGEGAPLGWCALCGRRVLATDRYLRVRGLIFHERCAAYRRRRSVSQWRLERAQRPTGSFRSDPMSSRDPVTRRAAIVVARSNAS